MSLHVRCTVVSLLLACSCSCSDDSITIGGPPSGDGGSGQGGRATVDGSATHTVTSTAPVTVTVIITGQKDQANILKQVCCNQGKIIIKSSSSAYMVATLKNHLIKRTALIYLTYILT